MVPVNFHQWKQAIRQILLAQSEMVTTEWDPFVAAWICYALSTDGIANNQPLLNLLDRMKRGLEEDAWSYERNLGSIALSLWLLKKKGDPFESKLMKHLVDKVLRINPDEKWSLLRDPEQVFLLAFGITVADSQPAKEHLITISREQMRFGLLGRRILYAAALKELGQDVTAPDLEPADEADIVALVWWAGKYQGNKREAWERFSSVAERIALEPESASDSQRILSVPEIAILYEAVSQEAKYPEPALLFDYFPFHDRLRSVAREHFMQGKYGSAIFEATKLLNELIQERSGINDKAEAELVQATMKQISSLAKLKIRFNDFLNEDSGRNEQTGLALICEGVFKAFQNPKGHKPEDHPLVKMDPYEALHQRIVINYLMIRIERATAQTEHSHGK
jgi:uncharacterized protein (TIGR02391 family)